LLGFYIHIETSSPTKEGDRAIIEAGPFKSDQNFCFTFYYHMFGKNIGGLNVYRTWWNRTNTQLLWSRSTSFDHWNKSSLDVGSGGDFYVSTEYIWGNYVCFWSWSCHVFLVTIWEFSRRFRNLASEISFTHEAYSAWI
jgi:hypothetical protein